MQLPHPVQGARASKLSPSFPTGNTTIPGPASTADPNMALSAPLPSLVGARRTSAGPPMGLAIPHLPMKRENGEMTPRSETWRDIVRHWMVWEPRLQLFVPLKDWPHHYYNGRHRRHFNTLYYQRSLIAKEFLHVYVCPSLLTAFFSLTLYLGSRSTRKTGIGHMEALSPEGTRTCSRRSRRHGNAIPTTGSAAASSSMRPRPPSSTTATRYGAISIPSFSSFVLFYFASQHRFVSFHFPLLFTARNHVPAFCFSLSWTLFSFFLVFRTRSIQYDHDLYYYYYYRLVQQACPINIEPRVCLLPFAGDPVTLSRTASLCVSSPSSRVSNYDIATVAEPGVDGMSAVRVLKPVTSFAFPGTAQPSLHGVPAHRHLLFSRTK